MNACITLILLWPHSFDEARVDIRQLPEYKTWIVHLQDGTAAQQQEAAVRLGAYGRHALPALAALRQALQKTDKSEIARQIAAALRGCGPAANEAVPDLEDAVKREMLDPAVALKTALAMGALPEPLVRRVLVVQRGIRDLRLFAEALSDGLRIQPVFVLATLLEYLPRWDDASAEFALTSLVVALDEPLAAAWQGVPVAEVRLPWVTPALLQKAEQALAPWVADRRKQRYEAGASLLMMLDPSAIDRLYPKLFRNYDLRIDIVLAPTLMRLQWFRMYPFLLAQLDDPDIKTRENAYDLIWSTISGSDDWGHAATQQARLCVLTGLQHPSAGVRIKVLDLLTPHLADNERIEAGFAATLRDPEPRVRFAAASSLHRERRPMSVEVVPLLQELVGSRDPELRVRAIDLLAKYGPPARRTVPTLLRLCQHNHPRTRDHAIVAVATLDPSTTLLRHHAKTLLASTERDIRQQTIILLAQQGPAARGALPELRTLLKDGPERYAETLIRLAIAALDPDETEATLAHFKTALPAAKDNDLMEDLSALAHPSAFPTKELLPTLRTLLTQRNKGQPRVQPAIASVCLRLDPQCEEARTAFAKGFDVYPNPWLLRCIQLQEHARPLLPAFLNIYQNSLTENRRRQDILRTLNRLGPHAVSLAPELAKHADGPLAPYVRHTLRVITREVRP